jgi:hypothetical protein
MSDRICKGTHMTAETGLPAEKILHSAYGVLYDTRRD